MRKLAIAAAVIGSVTHAAPASRHEHIIKAYGYHAESCARVVNGADPSQEQASRLYALGVWTGLNMGLGASTGHAMNADGIWGEIKLYCTNNPSVTLLNATWKIYSQFKAAGR